MRCDVKGKVSQDTGKDGSPLSSCDKVTEQDTGKRIEMVRLDDDISEKVTLIKMDIEGAEQDALLGSIRHIREEKPKLLISVYHINEDIWKILRMIIDMDPDQRDGDRAGGPQRSDWSDRGGYGGVPGWGVPPV